MNERALNIYISGSIIPAASPTALVFLEINSISTRNIELMALHQPMIHISAGKLNREGMAEILRQLIS